MKQFTIAYLYNVRHQYPNSTDPHIQLEADFDDPATTEWMQKHLTNCGFKVIPIEADEHAYVKLQQHKSEIDIALNLSEGIYGRDRECQLPAILEMLQIPYTGSGPLTEALALNKAAAKDILRAHGVPVLVHQVFDKVDEPLSSGLRYPLIVKPNSQGSSAGITNDSVVDDEVGLRRQLAYVINTFHQSALVEPFLSGREFSIPVLGNPPVVLPIIQSDHSVLPDGMRHIDSLEVKWIFEEETGGTNFVCPAKVSEELKCKIGKICLDTWNALGIVDLCRLDIRCDNQENPYFLEVNTPPGLIPPEVSTTSYFPLSAKAAGIDYDGLLKRIIFGALARYGIISSAELAEAIK